MEYEISKARKYIVYMYHTTKMNDSHGIPTNLLRFIQIDSIIIMISFEICLFFLLQPIPFIHLAMNIEYILT